MAEMSSEQILQRELQELKEIATTAEKHDTKVAKLACAYQMMRTIEALFSYLSEVTPEEHDTADSVIQSLHERGAIDEDMSSALQELCDVSQYLLDVAHADFDFIGEIVAYGQTYMQAIEIVYDTVRNSNSITQVEDNGAEES